MIRSGIGYRIARTLILNQGNRGDLAAALGPLYNRKSRPYSLIAAINTLNQTTTRMQQLEDPALIDLIIQQDEAALGELYDRYHRLVYSIALHVVGRPEDAEEITLDVFTSIWEKAGSYQSERAKVSTWLTANPAGYYDPWKVPHFKDPFVIASYKPWHINTYVESIKRSSPPIIIPGVIEYRTALDTSSEWRIDRDPHRRGRRFVALDSRARPHPGSTDLDRFLPTGHLSVREWKGRLVP